MERFAKIVNGYNPLTIFGKRSILDVWQSSKYTSDWSTLIQSQSSFNEKSLKKSNV